MGPFLFDLFFETGMPNSDLEWFHTESRSWILFDALWHLLGALAVHCVGSNETCIEYAFVGSHFCFLFLALWRHTY